MKNPLPLRCAPSLLTAATFAALTSHPLAAQDPGHAAEEADVTSVVERLFDGMRAGDSAMVRSTFAQDARLVSTVTRDGEPAMQGSSIDRFVEAVGQPRDEIWDERLWGIEVRIDDNLATVWTQYAFFIGATFSHCGVDAFQLFRSAEGWKIFQIADTRRTEGCEMPG